MKSLLFSSLLFIIYFFCQINLSAQIDSLSKGSQIRLSSIQNFYQPIICTFSKFGLNTVFISYINRKIEIPIQQIQKIEFLKTNKRNTLIGLIAGSLVGGIAFGTIMQLTSKSSTGWSKVGKIGFWEGFASGIIIGGGVGASIGYQIKTKNWQEIKILKQFSL
jgi:hypothetical protein